MRPLALLLLALSLTAAELEQITLTDGRRLVGYYDEAAGKLTMDGPTRAVLPVAPGQVVSRSPYIPSSDAAEKATEAAPKDAARPSRESSRTRLDKARAEAEHLRAKADSVEFDAMVEFLGAMDLTPQKVPDLGKDPRKSEIEQQRRTKEVNAERKAFAELLDKARLLKSDPTTGHGFEVKDLISKMRYLEEKAKENAAEAEARAAKAAR